MHRWASLRVCIALLPLGSSAATTGATKTWNNPAGGSWSTPSNWTGGLPGPNDTAAFPSFGGIAEYVVTVPSSVNVMAVTAWGSSRPRWSGTATITITEELFVSGKLTIADGLDVSAVSVAVGEFNIASLILDSPGTSLFVSGEMYVGDYEPGVVEVRGGATLLGNTLELTEDATLHVELASRRAGPPAYFFGPVFRAGTLSVETAAGFVPMPLAAYDVLHGGALNGAFDEVTPPMMFGQFAPIQDELFVMQAMAPEPLASIALTPNAVTTYIGFARHVDVLGTTISGVPVLACCGVDVTELVEPFVDTRVATYVPDAAGDGPFAGGVVGLDHGDANVRVVVSWDGQTIEAAVPVTVAAGNPKYIERVSLTSSGASGSIGSPPIDFSSPFLPQTVSVAMSGDGNFVAFTVDAPEFGDPPGGQPDYEPLIGKDRLTGAVSFLGLNERQTAVDEYTSSPALSFDGRYCAFTSWNDVYTAVSVWWRDQLSGESLLLTESWVGGNANGSSLFPSVSADGRYTVFVSSSTNMMPPDLNGSEFDLYLHDSILHELARFTNASGLQPDSGIASAQISGNGNTVVFASAATNLVPGPNGPPQIYAWDRDTNAISLVSMTPAGAPGVDASYWPSVDHTGRYVAFVTDADNLIGATSAGSRVIVRDRVANTTAGLDAGIPGIEASRSRFSQISGDGRYVVFRTEPLTPTPGNPLAGTRGYRVDRTTLAWDSLAEDPWGNTPDGCFDTLGISFDGSVVAFASVAPNLAPFDFDTHADVFVRTFWSGLGDLDGDGTVGAADLGILLGAWGSQSPDLDGDAVVGASDLAILLGNWG